MATAVAAKSTQAHTHTHIAGKVKPHTENFKVSKLYMLERRSAAQVYKGEANLAEILQSFVE